MDVLKAVETYVTKMVSTPSAMKVLLLDTHTTPIVSLASTQSTLLTHQVYLTDRIDNKKRDRMPHMKCVCFLQCSEESLAALESELREPKYGEYFLYFSNVLSKTVIERLAQVDEYEVVKEVQEYFADYAPVLPYLFSLNHTPSSTCPLYGSTPNSWDPKALERTVHGIGAVLLSLKKKPIIRYEKSSGMARKLAIEIQHHLQSEASLYDFRLTQVPPLLLILDRRNDPVTPLLSPWTYQAMVHELLGIHNGRVDLSLVPDIRSELSEITLTPSTDPFFQAHYLSTFGDLGTSLKGYVQSYQSRSLAQSPNSINSISDMKRFIEEYPEFKKLGGNVSKHVALVGELSRLVGRDKLLEVGEIEQGLATSAGADLKEVQAVIRDNAVPAWNKLRLVILYALRYQKTHTANIASLINLMLSNGVSRDDAKLVYVFMNVAGADQRQDDLFSTESLLAKGRSALKGLKGVENVYMQHSPHLSQTIENLLKGRLKETSHPFLESPGPNAGLQRPQDVIVFMIGGTTFTEARAISLMNNESTGGAAAGSTAYATRILLGGTCVHNSSSYVEMIRSAATSFPDSVYEPPPEAASNMPSLNLNLGGVNVSLGGPAGTGVYRTSSDAIGVQTEGIRDGVMNLLGKVKQGVDKIGAWVLDTLRRHTFSSRRAKEPGEDFFFVQSLPYDAGTAVGIADGVGGWSDQGVDSAVFSQALMYYASKVYMGEIVTEAALKGSSSRSRPKPKDVLKLAYDVTMTDSFVKAGSATTCLINFDAQTGMMYATNIGDTGFIIIRAGSIVYQSRAQYHGFNYPKQLLKNAKSSRRSRNNSSDSPRDAESYEVQLREKDIIIAYTDGLVDNVYPEEILEICSVVLHEHRHDHDRPQIMSDRIVDYARQCMRSKTLLTPFEREAIKQGVAHKGGKIDDITVVVTMVER
ncbi:vacuolar protein sorting-associated protein 45 [Pleurotus pulmonarius]|nr:vacuolar protein sorting-associated protein 45 [Pleurotus pulmonarius]KAF4590320.1 vacuolar protein sorting-associated protein 45 [Pleurotus pulmonarius]